MLLTPLISATELTHPSADRIIVDCRFSLAEPALGRQQCRQDRIPGACNLPFEQNLDEHGHFLPAETLAQHHKGDELSVHMCGPGVTACHKILASVHAGLPMPRLYVGSWSEWIRDPQRAVEQTAGDPH